MPDDPFDQLLSAGFPMENMTAEQREVIRGLGPEEVALLIEIARRLDDAAPDVFAHESNLAGGLLF